MQRKASVQVDGDKLHVVMAINAEAQIFNIAPQKENKLEKYCISLWLNPALLRTRVAYCSAFIKSSTFYWDKGDQGTSPSLSTVQLGALLSARVIALTNNLFPVALCRCEGRTRHKALFMTRFPIV